MSGWAPSTETGPNFRGTQRTTSTRGTAATRGTVATRGTGAARGTAVTRGTAAARGTHGRILARTGLLGVLAPPAARIPHVQESQKDRQGRPILKVAPHPVQRRHGQLHAEDQESVQSLGNNLAPPPSDTQGIWARRFESILPPKGPSSPATQGNAPQIQARGNYPQVEAQVASGPASGNSVIPQIDESFAPAASSSPPSSVPPPRKELPSQAATLARTTPKGVKWDDQINPYTPDLSKFRAPRPNPKYSGSMPSLPSVSEMNVSEDGIEGALGGAEKDIRNGIAPKHNFQDYGKSWVKSNWDNEGDNDEVLISPDFLQSFILFWVQEVPNNIRAEFLEQDISGHWDCDVDTNTGLLMEPVKMPGTMVDPSQVEEKTAWRQQNWTSSLLMRREINLAKHDNKHNPPRGWTETIIKPATPSNVIEESSNSKLYEPERSPHAPRVPCHMRPARKEDLEGVREIYNMEVVSGIQAVDTEPVSLDAFEKIFETTQELKMPFIVVISGPFQNKAADYVPGAQYPQSQNNPHLGQVLAFGYLTIWEPGLAGDMKSASRMTARVHVHVHPKAQGKKLGHACLDKIISTVSYRHASKLASGCEFVNPTNDPIYKFPRHHDRKYYSIYLYHYVRTKTPANANPANGTDDKDGEESLKARELYFNDCRFERLARFVACHRTNPNRSPGPFWLDAVVFQHICQTDLNFTHSY